MLMRGACMSVALCMYARHLESGSREDEAVCQAGEKLISGQVVLRTSGSTSSSRQLPYMRQMQRSAR
jgi:hypothetical protein